MKIADVVGVYLNNSYNYLNHSLAILNNANEDFGTLLTDKQQELLQDASIHMEIAEANLITLFLDLKLEVPHPDAQRLRENKLMQICMLSLTNWLNKTRKKYLDRKEKATAISQKHNEGAKAKATMDVIDYIKKHYI